MLCKYQRLHGENFLVLVLNFLYLNIVIDLSNVKSVASGTLNMEMKCIGINERSCHSRRAFDNSTDHSIFATKGKIEKHIILVFKGMTNLLGSLS